MRRQAGLAGIAIWLLSLPCLAAGNQTGIKGLGTDRIVFLADVPAVLRRHGRTRSWNKHKKNAVERALVKVYDKAPGLVVRAARYRPIRFHLLRGRYRIAARALISANAIQFTPRFFRAGPRGRMAILAHELMHLADSGFRYSAGAPFTDIAQPRIAAARAALTRRRLTWHEAIVRRARAPARRVGLPGPYAAYAQYEALAEMTGAYVAGRYRPPPEIASYLKTVMSWPDDNKSPVASLWHEAQEMRIAGAGSAEVVDRLDRAVYLEPGFFQARLLRARLNLERERVSAARDDLKQVVFKAHAGFQAGQARSMLSLIAAHSQRPGPALAHAADAIDRHPTSADLYLLRARLRLASGKYKAALDDYRIARRFGRRKLTGADRKGRRLAVAKLRAVRIKRTKRRRRRRSKGG